MPNRFMNTKEGRQKNRPQKQVIESVQEEERQHNRREK